MKSSLFSILCLIFSVAVINGQPGRSADHSEDIFTRLLDEGTDGQITIRADSLLVANYYKFLTSNSKIRGVPGYRIRIYSESGIGAKEEQQRVRARFLSYFPEIDAYYRYDEPFFKLYVGDCRTKSEALKLYDRVKKYFPNPILVEDYINLKSADQQTRY